MENEIKIPKKPGRPRLYDIPDCKNRASIIHNIYVTKKYKSDPEFRKKIRETNNRAKRAYDARQRLKKLEKLEKPDETKND